MRFAGRTALVTGASRGLGAHLAHAFAAEGANLVVTARGAEALERTAEDLRRLGVRVVAFVGDCGDPEVVARLFEGIDRECSGIDIVVCNAAVLGPAGPLATADMAAWADVLRGTLLGPALVCHAAVPRLAARPRGKLIAVSGGGATGPLANFSAYAAAKAGLVRLVETLAVECAALPIDINAIAPGILPTGMTEAALAAGEERIGAAYARRLREALQTAGDDPFAEAVALALFLASHESDGITGRLISARWDDWAALPAHREAVAGSDLFTLRRIAGRDRDMDWADR